MTAAIAPPAERPVTKTRLGSSPWSATIRSTIALIEAASPRPRRLSPSRNQSKQRSALLASRCCGRRRAKRWRSASPAQPLSSPNSSRRLGAAVQGHDQRRAARQAVGHVLEHEQVARVRGEAGDLAGLGPQRRAADKAGGEHGREQRARQWWPAVRRRGIDSARCCRDGRRAGRGIGRPWSGPAAADVRLERGHGAAPNLRAGSSTDLPPVTAGHLLSGPRSRACL